MAQFLGVIRPLPPSAGSAPTSHFTTSPIWLGSEHTACFPVTSLPPARFLSPLPARWLLLAAARLSTPMPRQPLAAGPARTPSVPPAPALANMALVLAAERGRCCLWALRRQ